ncbi:Glycosyl phosphatidyl inositol protein transamidase complex subunit, partial [Serendipita sp. 399]
YRIDAITLYAVPAKGPHGFHSLGRVVESLLRTSNNLLERLHASFFFYLFTAPGEFAEFARYLPPVIILGLAVSFGGLRLFVQTGWIQKGRKPQETTEKQSQAQGGPLGVWSMRDRPILEVVCTIGATYLVGISTLFIVSSRWAWTALKESRLSEVALLSSLPSITLLVFVAALSRFYRLPPTTPALLKAFNLCGLGVVISVIAVANFSLSVSVAILASLPLCLVPVSLHGEQQGQDARQGSQLSRALIFAVRRVLAILWLSIVSPQGLVAAAHIIEQQSMNSTGSSVAMWLQRILWESVILKTWFLPLVSIIYLPHILQGLIVCVLPI